MRGSVRGDWQARMLLGTGVNEAARLSPAIAAPVLDFDLDEVARALRLERPWREGGHNARTLIKHSGMRIVLIVLKAGARLREHQTGHPISVQTLTGRVQLTTPNERIELPAGRILALDEAVPHDLVAIEESSVLLSMGWAPAR